MSKRAVNFLVFLGLLLTLIGTFFLFAFPLTQDSDASKLEMGGAQLTGQLGIKQGTSQSTGIGLYDSNGILLAECYQGDCGYPNWRHDIGKPAKFELSNGRVSRIEVGGEIRFSPNDFAMANNRHRTRAQLCIVVGVILAAVGIALGLRERLAIH